MSIKFNLFIFKQIFKMLPNQNKTFKMIGISLFNYPKTFKNPNP